MDWFTRNTQVRLSTQIQALCIGERGVTILSANSTLSPVKSGNGRCATAQSLAPGVFNRQQRRRLGRHASESGSRRPRHQLRCQAEALYQRVDRVRHPYSQRQPFDNCRRRRLYRHLGRLGFHLSNLNAQWDTLRGNTDSGDRHTDHNLSGCDACGIGSAHQRGRD